MKAPEFMKTCPLILRHGDMITLVFPDKWVEVGIPIIMDKKLFNGEPSVSLDLHGQEIIGMIGSLSGVDVTNIERWVTEPPGSLREGVSSVSVIWDALLEKIDA